MAKEKILVVDDEEDILELVRYNLSREGYRVTGTLTGEDALRKVRSDSFDLIVLDLMLPGMDGLAFTKTLKNDSRLRSIPIIMLTAKGEEADIVTGLELGADDYITKPFSPRELVSRVKALLHNQALCQAQRHGGVVSPLTRFQPEWTASDYAGNRFEAARRFEFQRRTNCIPRCQSQHGAPVTIL